MIPAEGFAVIEGEPVIGGLHGPTRHLLRPRCLSWVFTQPEGMVEIVALRATLLGEHGWSEPFLEVWTSEALP